jgi:hypothetical protein
MRLKIFNLESRYIQSKQDNFYFIIVIIIIIISIIFFDLKCHHQFGHINKYQQQRHAVLLPYVTQTVFQNNNFICRQELTGEVVWKNEIKSENVTCSFIPLSVLRKIHSLFTECNLVLTLLVSSILSFLYDPPVVAYVLFLVFLSLYPFSSIFPSIVCFRNSSCLRCHQSK